MGCGAAEGTVQISRDETNLGYNQIGRNVNTEEIAIIPLDSYIKDRDIGFIKMDVEMYEPQVLTGLYNYISTTKNLPYIVMEYVYKGENKDRWDEVFDWLFQYYEAFDYIQHTKTTDILLKPL